MSVSPLTVGAHDLVCADTEPPVKISLLIFYGHLNIMAIAVARKLFSVNETNKFAVIVRLLIFFITSWNWKKSDLLANVIAASVDETSDCESESESQSQKNRIV